MWMFSYLCSEYGYRLEWKAAADSCKSFLENHCIDRQDGRMYYCVTREGKPLRKRRYHFCEMYYTCACAEYAKAFSDEASLKTARQYYMAVIEMQQNLREDPYHVPPKFIPETRAMRGMAPVMMMIYITNSMLRCDPANRERYNRMGWQFKEELFKYFYHEERHALLETVGERGEFLPQWIGGRTVLPGHGMEVAWFLVENMMLTGDYSGIEKAENIFSWSVDMGWDQTFGGLKYFADVLGYPSETVEANMKLWWENCEMIIAAIYLYEVTGNPKYYTWFKTADKYLFRAFRDEQYGEWFGYLHYDNTVDRPACKGNLYKGFFHIPRMLTITGRAIERILDK
jgi:N-acylglucosamine 2-epimerase